ncbi:MAG: type IV secretion system DNA-binding domain-containing protein [Chloroflexi bacterium]|nr:type IV secretion system DNA-binding domain-containing protein [Chloroflexota bacterium]
MSLERVSAGNGTPWAQPLKLLKRPAQEIARAKGRACSEAQLDMKAIEIIPPRENTIDVLAVENLLGTLAAETPFSLEIAGDGNGRHFLLRASANTLGYLLRQLQAVYSQASFREVAPEQDLARPDGGTMATAYMKLARPVYLPLRTLKDGSFREADPMLALLGAFAIEQDRERVLSQLILSPAPEGWAKRYMGSARQIEQSMSGQAMTMGLYFRQFASVILVIVTLGACLYALMMYLQHHWLEFMACAFFSALCAGGVALLYKFLVERDNADPKLVQRKTEGTAYDVSFRLVAVAPSPERAQRLLRQLAMAYRQFGSSSGNALIAHRAAFDPRQIGIEPWTWWEQITEKTMRLNVAELATLWHLPVGQDVQLIERTQAKRLLPLPTDVQKGILVGRSRHQGQTIPVHLAPESLWHHVFMVAKTQKGKSTLMAHLAVEAMRQAERTALVVIDPHGDLARSLLGLVPRERAGDVVYIDFSDRQQVVGLNLLDMSQGRDADAIVSNVVHTGELIWSDYWGPRMEDALRMALRTLLAANEKLAQKNEKQFTLIDIPALYELPNFRHRLLEQYVSDQEILRWWTGYFERLYESLRMDVINPVLTKIHRFSTHTVVRNVVGQSVSTVNFRKLLDEGRILMVNTATGVIGPDAGGLLGAVLVDFINFAVREQMAIPDPKARARVVVVVDEFQSIPGVDYPGLLAELQKMGASFILATQALGQLKAISANLHDSIFSNIATLFVFQTSAEDADFLRHELDEAVTATDIINLANYTCYLRSELENQRLPVIHIETLPPDKGNPTVVEQIMGQMTRYTRPAKLVDEERTAFQAQWYGREMNLIRQTISLKGNEPTKPDKDEKQEDSKEESKKEGEDDKNDRKKGKPSKPAKDSKRSDENTQPGTPPSETGETTQQEKKDAKPEGSSGSASASQNKPRDEREKPSDKEKGNSPTTDEETRPKGKSDPRRANP